MALERKAEEIKPADNQAKIDELARTLQNRHANNNRQAYEAMLGWQLSESSTLTTPEQREIAQQRYLALVQRYRWAGTSPTWYWEVLEDLVKYLEEKEAEYQRTNPRPGSEPSWYEYALRLFRPGVDGQNYFAKKNNPPTAYGIVLPELLACLWLATKDENLPLNFDIEKSLPPETEKRKEALKKIKEQALKESFVFNLYNIRTEHTKDYPEWWTWHVQSGYRAEHASCLEGAFGRMIKIMWPISPITTIFDTNRRKDEKYLSIPSHAQAFVMVMLQGSTPEIKKAVFQVVTKKSLFLEEVAPEELRLYEQFYASLSMSNFYNFLMSRVVNGSSRPGLIDFSRPRPGFNDFTIDRLRHGNQPSDYEMVAEILSRTRRNYEITKLETPNANVVEQLRRPGAQLLQEQEILKATEQERVMLPRRTAHDKVEELKAIEFSLRNAALRSLIAKDKSDVDAEAIQMLPILTLHSAELEKIKLALERLKRDISAVTTEAATAADAKFQEDQGIQALGRNAKAVNEATKKAEETSTKGLDKISKLLDFVDDYKAYVASPKRMQSNLLKSLGLQSLSVGGRGIPSYLDRFIDVAFSNNGAYFTKAEEMKKLTKLFEKLDSDTQRLNFTVDSYGEPVNLGEKILSSFPESNNWRYKQAAILFLNHLINVYNKDQKGHELDNAQPNLPQFEMLSDDDKKAIQMFVELQNQCAPGVAIDLGYHATIQFDELIGRQPDQYPYLKQAHFSVPKVVAVNADKENKEEESDIVDHDPQNEKSDRTKLQAWQETAIKDILKTQDLLIKSDKEKGIKDARFDAMVKFLEVSLCSNLGLTALRKSDIRFFETLCSIYLTQTGAEEEDCSKPIAFLGSDVDLFYGPDLSRLDREKIPLSERVEMLAKYFSVLVDTLRPYRTEYNVGLIRLMDRETANAFCDKVGVGAFVLRTGVGAPDKIINTYKLQSQNNHHLHVDFDNPQQREKALKQVSKQLLLVDYNHLTAAAAEMAQVHNNTRSNYVTFTNARGVERKLGGNALANMAASIIAGTSSPQQEQKTVQSQEQEVAARKREQEAATRKQHEEKTAAARKEKEAVARQVVKLDTEEKRLSEVKNEAKQSFFNNEPSVYRGFERWYVQRSKNELVNACIMFFNDKNNKISLGDFVKQLKSGDEILRQIQKAGGYQDLVMGDFSFSKNGMHMNIQSCNNSPEGKKVQCSIVADVGQMWDYLKRYAPELEEKVAIRTRVRR